MSKGRRSPTVTMSGWRGCGDSCSVTQLFTDVMHRSAPDQHKLLRWTHCGTAADHETSGENDLQWNPGLRVCRFEPGPPKFGLRQLGECVRGPSHCDEDHSTFFEEHFQDCVESKSTRDSWSTQPGSHNRDPWVETFLLTAEDTVAQASQGGVVLKAQLQERVDKFLQGHWVPLLETSLELSVQGTASCRRRRGQKDTVVRRATRAFDLCQLGELSSGRQALVGAAIAPQNSRTQKLLQDETRRPPEARSPTDPSILEVEPEKPFNLDVDLLLKNLRTVRRGAAAGPSGMTAE